MDLENDINNTNSYYLDNDIAIVYKKPTPIKVSKVNYNKNHTIITEAFYEMPSTTDYNGIYKGKYIDFDAKEVKNSSSFALSNLHAPQAVIGGISAGVICFCLMGFDKLFIQ